MTDISETIKQLMQQIGVPFYTVRPMNVLVAHNSTLPAGRFYYIPLQNISQWLVVANNVIWTSVGVNYAFDLPLFQGQVHFVDLNNGGMPDPKGGGKQSYLTILEITPDDTRSHQKAV